MTVNKDVALKLWHDIFGDDLWAQDCFGTWMYRDDYGNNDKTRNNRPGGSGRYFNYGWDVDHIMPVSRFEGGEAKATFWNNLEPLHHSNNLAKSDNTSFEIGGRNYSVVRCNICKNHGLKGYGILDVTSGKRVDWKFVFNSYYEG